MGRGGADSGTHHGRKSRHVRSAILAAAASHELFHEWNPRRLNYPDDEELYWFTEGFTDYYTVAGLWHSGVWTFDDVIADFNKVARHYYVSPARNFTASQMVELRQSNISANQLPYRKGYLLAASWNRRGKGLDSAMRSLLGSNREPLSNARIAKAVRSIGIKEAAGEIQRFVVEGKTIELPADIWGTCAAEFKAPFRAFDMGFDWTQSERTRHQGYKAGQQCLARRCSGWAEVDVHRCWSG